MYKVCTPNKRWIGIIETNWSYAIGYWTKRGYILIRVNNLGY